MRKALTNERVRHVNRIKGLLFAQGVSGYEPLRRDQRTRLEALRTGDGRPLPAHLKAQVGRELDRLELLIEQIKAVEAERDAMLAAAPVGTAHFADCKQPAPAMLLGLKGIGPEFAAVLWSEGLSRDAARLGYYDRRIAFWPRSLNSCGPALAHIEARVERTGEHPLTEVGRHTAEAFGYVKSSVALQRVDIQRRLPRWIEGWSDRVTGQLLQIDENDLRVAAQAVERNLVVVTSDPDFTRVIAPAVPELRIQLV